MLKKYLASVLLVICCVKLSAQELSHEVLVPMAGVVSGSRLEFTQTIGEAVVEILSTPDIVLTQGFQQPRIVFSKDIVPLGNGVNVYPNPVIDFVNVELFGDISRSFTIEILTISGTLVINDKVEFPDAYWQINRYPVGLLSRGLYFLRVISDDGVINRTFKITKM